MDELIIRRMYKTGIYPYNLTTPEPEEIPKRFLKPILFVNIFYEEPPLPIKVDIIGKNRTWVNQDKKAKHLKIYNTN